MAQAAGAPLFGDFGNINVGLGKGELPTATITHPSGASCEVVLTGAHVTSWKTREGTERLFMSSASKFGAGAAIRGGIPVCFPQFSGRGSLPKHGFARTSAEWELETIHSEGASSKEEGKPCTLVLRLADTEASRAAWPHAFSLRYTITLTDATLCTELELVNKGDAPLTFTAALHTYFAVTDVTAVRVLGLQGLTYEDNAAGGSTAKEAQAEVPILGEVDRVYLDAPERVQMKPSAGDSLLTVSKTSGFKDVVVWNLGEVKAPSMADLGEGEWRKYVCIEAGAIGTPVSVAPGASFKAAQTFDCKAL
jgi:glucose-6-phosphate 1-epimerase